MHRVSLEDYERNIIALDEQCKKNGAQLILISPPLNKDSLDKWERSTLVISYRHKLNKTAKLHGIPLIEITEMTEKADGSTAEYFTDPVHPSKEGHILIMKKLYAYLVEKGYLGVSSNRKL